MGVERFRLQVEAALGRRVVPGVGEGQKREVNRGLSRFSAIESDPIGYVKAGQLFSDIVAFERGIGKRYIYTPAAQATPEQILNYIEELIIKPKNADNLQAAFGMTKPVDIDVWDVKVDEIMRRMRYEGFVEVNNLSNIIQ